VYVKVIASCKGGTFLRHSVVQGFQQFNAFNIITFSSEKILKVLRQ